MFSAEIEQNVRNTRVNLMGFRFRKSFRVLPGVRLNLSKTGVGASFGFKGFRITKRADGKTQKTFTLPGTGISYVFCRRGSILPKVRP